MQIKKRFRFFSQVPMHCTLCSNRKPVLWAKDHFRAYFKCPECNLVFVPDKFHLSPDKEKERYDLHNNDPEDEGYKNFLNRLILPLIPYLKKGDKGIDFGSGPTPSISILMKKRGFSVTNYDPFYSNKKDVLNQTYDFLTCVETVEHFHHPQKEWKRMIGMVKPGKWIGVMTQLLTDEIDFRDWYYNKDVTHVCFYSKATFEWLALKHGFKINYMSNSVLLFQVG
ncbi:class I SAM-dependent methyltransferase [bacterium]|nr:class I SAM-dependent methyltransferase [bacterium]